eukprot:scaffold1415_cov117-Isochrysis_galbana.AAC.16
MIYELQIDAPHIVARTHPSSQQIPCYGALEIKHPTVAVSSFVIALSRLGGKKIVRGLGPDPDCPVRPLHGLLAPTHKPALLAGLENPHGDSFGAAAQALEHEHQERLELWRQIIAALLALIPVPAIRNV